MGQIFNRINRLIKAEINHSDSDPEKVLEQMIFCMQENLMQLRQAVAQAIATNKRTEQQYNQAKNEADRWQRNAHLALQKGDENLARQALERKKSFAETANALKANLDKHCGQVDTLKRSLITLESKISEAKTKKDMLKARSSAAKAAEQLPPNVVERLGTNSAAAAFERMEEKILMQEARAQSAAELVNADLESQFEPFVTFADVDDELAALKAQVLLGSGQSDGSKSNQVLDSDLEQLKKQLDQL